MTANWVSGEKVEVRLFKKTHHEVFLTNKQLFVSSSFPIESLAMLLSHSAGVCVVFKN